MATQASGKEVAPSGLSPATSTGNTADDVPTNPRGIPQAPFVDRVEDYVASRAEVEPTLRRFQEMISKYQFMEANLQRRVAGLDEKLPDIRKTLETVEFLRLRRQRAKNGDGDGDDDGGGSDVESNPDSFDDAAGNLTTTFELNDTLYAKAVVPPTHEVYLWLGANVMLAYPIDEAQTLLRQKLSAAQTSRRQCEEDLEFLREQITTMEVAIARVYNWDVVQKRKEGGAGESSRTAAAGDADG
ncbi:prefoldin subunit [Niveomyces insectorum RCEF 264]|uniref:Prefoldin subunit n=1 Tax=Niveomyces insectorum RCEF 264 TaxID=1081102 RepID=A0A167S3W3_9HYPO|nr:prefoldin subunit [Niveomyces insectorum RCEF 264]